MERVTRRGLNFLLVLFAILTALLFLTVVPYFPYVFFGAFAAFLIYPIYLRLAKRLGRYFAAWIMVLAVYMVMFIPIFALIASIIQDLLNAAVVLREQGAESIILGVLVEILPREDAERFAALIGNALVDAGNRFLGNAPAVAMELLLGFFIFGFICFYTLLKGDAVVAFVREAIPLRDFRTQALFNQIKLSLNAVFYGVIFVAVIQGTAGGIVWWIAGLPNPFFYGAVMFLLSIIPFAGPSFVLIPVGVLKIIQGDVGMGVFLIASGVFFVGSIDNVLRPVMVSRFGDINPAMVVVGLAGGLVAFGLVGMVLGPLIFALWSGVARELHFEITHWKTHAFGEDEEHEEKRLHDEMRSRTEGKGGGGPPGGGEPGPGTGKGRRTKKRKRETKGDGEPDDSDAGKESQPSV